MKSDDLSSLFAPNPRGAALPATFRQAVLLSFDQADGSNVVGIGTSEILNVPFLLTGAEVGFNVGDNVLVMYLGNSAMIVGKIASVGSQAFGSRSVASTKFGDNTTGFALPTSSTTLVSFTMTAPLWANRVSATGAGFLVAHNTFGSDVDMFADISLDGDDSGSVDTYAHATSTASIPMAHVTKHSIVGGSDIVFSMQGWCTGGFSASGGNICQLNVLAIWTKE